MRLLYTFKLITSRPASRFSGGKLRLRRSLDVYTATCVHHIGEH